MSNVSYAMSLQVTVEKDSASRFTRVVFMFTGWLVSIELYGQNTRHATTEVEHGRTAYSSLLLSVCTSVQQLF